MSHSALSPAPVICGRNASPLPTKSKCFLLINNSCRLWSGPLPTRGGGKCHLGHQDLVSTVLQARAKAPLSSSEEKQTSRTDVVFEDHENTGVRNICVEICDTTSRMQLAAGFSVAVAFLVAFTDVGSAIARPGEIDLPPIEPEVATVSSAKEINLAKQLRAIGAKMYGAFWCSHCFEQKQMFGKEALKYIDYVECYPEGYRRGVKLAAACSAANIQGFPTWIINGQQYSGEQEFDKLAELSGFNTPRVMK